MENWGLAGPIGGGVVGLGLILEVSLRYITYLYLTTSDDAALERLDLIQISLVAVGSVLTGLLFRAMIIAGFDNRRPGFWGWIGIVISGLRTLFLTFTTVSLLFPSLAVPLALVKIELRELNNQLPQDMGDGLTLYRAYLKGAEMWYYYWVDYPLEVGERVYFEDSLNINSEITQDICTDMHGYFLGGVESINYEYNFPNETVFAALSNHTCFAFMDSN